jgi:hypothetical protein
VGGGVFNVADDDGALRAGAGDGVDVDAEGRREAARGRRDPPTVGAPGYGTRGRSRLGLPWCRLDDRGRFDRGGAGSHRRCVRCVGRLAGFQQRRQGRAHLDGLADRHEQITDGAVVPTFHFHGGFRGLDHRDDLTAGNGVAGFDQPFVQRSLVHVGTERGHLELDHDRSPNKALTAATMLSFCGNAACSRCLA